LPLLLQLHALQLPLPPLQLMQQHLGPHCCCCDCRLQQRCQLLLLLLAAVQL
jgi:hypothetical protein